MKQGIHWIASYPKSGNTWIRIFLINLLHPELTTSIDQLGFIRPAASRSLFDEYSDISASDLTYDEVFEMRSEIYAAMAKAHSSPVYLKIHDAHQQKALFPREVTQSALYLVRNPIDLAVSFAAFKQVSIDQMIEEMGDQGSMLSRPNQQRLTVQLPQELRSWSEHVSGWTKQQDFPLLVIRYEDLLQDPLTQFKTIVDFFGLNFSIKEIEIAIQKSSFSNLKEQEQEQGFHEKYSTESSFFRKGMMGEGYQKLSAEQIRKIEADHREQMQHFNYL